MWLEIHILGKCHMDTGMDMVGDVLGNVVPLYPLLTGLMGALVVLVVLNFHHH